MSRKTKLSPREARRIFMKKISSDLSGEKAVGKAKKDMNDLTSPSKKEKGKSSENKALENAKEELSKLTQPRVEKKKKSKKKKRKSVSQKKALDTAKKDMTKITSPRHASVEERRAWRKKRIAELKKSLASFPVEEEDTDSEEEEASEEESASTKKADVMPGGNRQDQKASKSDRVNAFKVYQMIKEKVPLLFGREAEDLASLNETLEDAIMSNDQSKIRASLSMLLAKIQAKAKNRMQEMSALGKTIRLVHKKMDPRVASTRFAYVAEHVQIVDKFDRELKRAEVLINLAAKNIRL